MACFENNKNLIKVIQKIKTATKINKYIILIFSGVIFLSNILCDTFLESEICYKIFFSCKKMQVCWILKTVDKKIIFIYFFFHKGSRPGIFAAGVREIFGRPSEQDL